MRNSLKARLSAMENFLFYKYQGGHERTNGGWCDEDCAMCEKMQIAYTSWEKSRQPPTKKGAEDD